MSASSCWPAGPGILYWATDGGAVLRQYLHVEGQVAGLGLFQVTLGVLQSHLKTVGLRLHLTQLGLLPLGLHLFL